MQRYVHIASGLTLTAADGGVLPGCMFYAVGSADTGQTRRDELCSAAEKLGIDVPSKATKAEIAALIDAEAVKRFGSDEQANAGRPPHVAPIRPRAGGGADGE